ncbi:precorrin-6A synthase (deacetylating) [Paraburkholderia sp. CNPSo 3274]|uniref:precorrin-6A synthase (deacetylating) n=1 Tax=Paraburkholderia sp. CNPSo 3274 TaxID=2940932 RepID=UPI0020B8B4AA|nr:precorrin-6A synthase (deacetylating) [Paraburkholderia sp. CNPSo 3274]MCP3706205.1 precorrin-6A synthase (deacetylating) [Paraburkholderia sp. CNPSo 3274]
MKKILIIGIGAGDPKYLTVQAIEALNAADVFFVMDKGAAKDKLVALRKEICARFIKDHDYRIVEATSPERRRGEGLDYRAAVDELNRDKQRVFEGLIEGELTDGQCGAFLVWGDPSLYDSTIRILDSTLAEGRLAFDFEVIPGISSVQALAAKHRVPLNFIGKPVSITTGRRLAEGGFPPDVESAVVMLDAQNAYAQLTGEELDIYWGAYVGTPDEILMSGRLEDVKDEIVRVRAQAREANGWIMDTYLLRKRGVQD